MGKQKERKGGDLGWGFLFSEVRAEGEVVVGGRKWRGRWMLELF